MLFTALVHFRNEPYKFPSLFEVEDGLLGLEKCVEVEHFGVEELL